MKHTQTAIETAKGSTWDLDRDAERREWEGIDIGYSQHRDSDVLVRSNWETIHNDMEKIFGLGNGWNVDSLGHWAVGWVEFITFDTARTDIKEYFEKVRAGMDDYPVLDEELMSTMEWQENHPVMYGRYEECYCDDDDCPVKLEIQKNKEKENASIDD